MTLQWFSSWPSVALRGQKEVAVAVAVLRGPPCPPWTNVLPLQFFVFLRGPSWTNVLPLQFFVFLRGPSWTNVLPLQFSAALRVLRGQMCCRCSSPRPSVSSVDKCVAVAVLRVPPWPSVDKRKLQSPLQFSAALRALRGQMCCRCSSSCSFAALRGQMCCRCSSSCSFAALRGQMCCRCSSSLRGQMCCRCSSSCSFAALRGQMCCRCSSNVFVAVLRGPPRPFVDKCVAVAVLRVPSRPFVDKCVAVAVLRGPPCRCAALRGQKRCSPSPFLDKPYSHIAVHSRTTSITDETWNWNRWNSCIIMA